MADAAAGDTADRTAEPAREVWITGVGIVSTLGEGLQAHWQGLHAPPGPADLATWAPFVIHPIAPLDLAKQIPKKGDQRPMEAWHPIGAYAAGRALVGGCAHADQISTMPLFVMGHRLWRGELKALWERAAAGGGLASGSIGAFVVLEEKAHALARGVAPFARLSAVLSGHTRRTP